MSTMYRYKNYCVTLFNVADLTEEHLVEWKAKGIAYGHEVCPKSGRSHLQAFVSFLNNLSPCAARKRLSPHHVEVMRGKMEENESYCSKESSLIVLGVMPRKNSNINEEQKEKWQNAYDNAKIGQFELIPPDMYIRYRNSFKAIYNENRKTPPDLDEKKNWWIYGKTGTGKTRVVKNTWKDEDVYEHDHKGGKFFSLYQDQPIMWVDEMDPYDVALCSQVKRWGDHYAFSVQSKGSDHRKIRPKTVVITSNYHPGEIWPKPQDHMPILRRYNIVEFKNYDPNRVLELKDDESDAGEDEGVKHWKYIPSSNNV